MKFLLPAVTLLIGIIGGILLNKLSVTANKKKTNITQVTLRGLGEVTGQSYDFAEVIQKSCDQKILPSSAEHAPLIEIIRSVAAEVGLEMSKVGSPAREHRRINEVSADFEEALRLKLDAHADLTCDFPKTRDGKTQRSGYPDLRVEHLPTRTIAYLDPKLFEEKSMNSSFRSFYYEPGGGNTKITEDALHLLLGYPHDGRTREWTFAAPHLVDLSKLTVTLKTEFSASNKEVYRGLTEQK